MTDVTYHQNEAAYNADKARGWIDILRNTDTPSKRATIVANIVRNQRRAAQHAKWAREAMGVEQ